MNHSVISVYATVPREILNLTGHVIWCEHCGGTIAVGEIHRCRDLLEAELAQEQLDTPYGAVVALPAKVCPSCGRTDGAPVRLGTGETSSTTGYCDEGEGCTLCDPRREREQAIELKEDGDVNF